MSGEVRQEPEVGQEEYGGSVRGRRAGDDGGGKVGGKRPSTRRALGEKDGSRGVVLCCRQLGTIGQAVGAIKWGGWDGSGQSQ